jgi:hypothetical protein
MSATRQATIVQDISIPKLLQEDGIQRERGIEQKIRKIHSTNWNGKLNNQKTPLQVLKQIIEKMKLFI